MNILYTKVQCKGESHFQLLKKKLHFVINCKLLNYLHLYHIDNCSKCPTNPLVYRTKVYVRILLGVGTTLLGDITLIEKLHVHLRPMVKP